MKRLRSAVLALLSFLLMIIPAYASNAVEDFFRGRTITSIVPFGPGGGYAIYNQIMARHLGKFLPGNPQINPSVHAGRRRHRRE